MSRKTGLIISWNWTRGYGIVQEQELPTYDKDDIVMVIKQFLVCFENKLSEYCNL